MHIFPFIQSKHRPTCLITAYRGQLTGRCHHSAPVYKSFYNFTLYRSFLLWKKDLHLRDRDLVVFEFTTTCSISAYHHKAVSSNLVFGDVYSMVTCGRSVVFCAYSGFLHQ